MLPVQSKDFFEKYKRCCGDMVDETGGEALHCFFAGCLQLVLGTPWLWCSLHCTACGPQNPHCRLSIPLLHDLTCCPVS